MATSTEIDAVVDAVITAFDSDPALWAAFLERSKLETEVAQLESGQRKQAAIFSDQSQTHMGEMDTLTAEIEAKKAEIDALA